MNQYEFDKKMQEYHLQQDEMTRPYTEKVDAIRITRNELVTKIQALKSQVAELGAQIHILETEKKRINAEFWEKKHKLLVDNPKSEMEDNYNAD